MKWRLLETESLSVDSKVGSSSTREVFKFSFRKKKALRLVADDFQQLGNLRKLQQGRI